MVGEINGILVISNLSVDKDGAVNPALVMQRSHWRRREIRRICSVDKTFLIPLISEAWRIRTTKVPQGKLITACHILIYDISTDMGLSQEDFSDRRICNDGLKCLCTQAVTVHESSIPVSMSLMRSPKVGRLRAVVRASVMFCFGCRAFVVWMNAQSAAPMTSRFGSLRYVFSKCLSSSATRVFVSFIGPLYVCPFLRHTSHRAIISYYCIEYVLQVGSFPTWVAVDYGDIVRSGNIP